MEKLPERGELWFWRVPVFGRLGKAAAEHLGARGSFNNVARRLDEQDGQEEYVLETTLPIVSDQMLPVQAQSLAIVKARRLMRHIELGEPDVPDRLTSLMDLMNTHTESCGLESLNLGFDQEESLRIMLKEAAAISE